MPILERQILADVILKPWRHTLGEKYFLGEKFFFGWKNFFWVKKIFLGEKNFFGWKKFWVKKYFLCEKILGEKIFFGWKDFFGGKKFFWVKKFFWAKNINYKEFRIRIKIFKYWKKNFVPGAGFELGSLAYETNALSSRLYNQIVLLISFLSYLNVHCFFMIFLIHFYTN